MLQINDVFRLVHKSASDKDIRHAYKKLSKKFHPDKNKDPGAEERFVEIAHAYEVLSDATVRNHSSCRWFDPHTLLETPNI